MTVAGGGPSSVTASVPGAASMNFSPTDLPLATLTIAFAGNATVEKLTVGEVRPRSAT